MTEKQKEVLNRYLPAITCWGDSLTQGCGGGGVTYGTELDAYIKENVLKGTDAVIPVTNMGVGGETSYTILGRAGVLPYVLDADITVPADKTPVEITFSSKSGKQVDPLVQDGAGIKGVNPCVIHGVKGTLSIVKNTPGEIHIFHGLDKYFFTRSEEGEEVKAAKGTEIETAGRARLSDFPVIYIGQNGSWSTPEELIEQIRLLIGNHDRYVVMTSHHNVSYADSAAREEKLKAAFGQHIIVLREYMSSEWAVETANTLYNAGIVLTEDDKKLMNDGMTPACLRVDGCHYNVYGYKLIGKLLCEKMEALGYFDEVRAAFAE